MQILKGRSKRPRNHGKTSTLEVLGGAAENKIPRKWGEHYRRLMELREQFLKGRSSQSEDASEGLSTSTEHIADAATDSYDRDCALALLSSTQNALYEIDQALLRIKEGTYGLCEVSGERIEEARLKAIPWTRFSAAAQRQLEAQGAGGRVQLGELGTCLAGEGNEGDAEEEAGDSAIALSRREAA